MAIMTIAAIAAIAGTANQLANSGDGGSYGASTPYQYIPAASAGSDLAWQQLLQTAQPYARQVPGQVNPLLQQALQTSQNAPYTGYSQAGQQAASYYPGIAAQAGQYGDLLKALGLGAASGGAQVMQTAFDPQNALYGRTVQQLQDQVRAANTAAGVATTPYGAGLEGQAMSNFNIDWQNQQLQRQQQGLLSYLQGNQLAGQDITSSLSMYGQQPTNILQGGQLPVATQADIANYLNQAAGAYSTGVGQSLAPGGAQQSQIISYLNSGQGAGQNAYSQFANQQAFNANQQQGATSGLVQALNQFSQSNAGQGVNNWLGNIFGNSGSSGGGGSNPWAGLTQNTAATNAYYGY